MSENNWTIVGYLGNYPRQGTTKTDLPWYGNTVSVTKGKDKQTGKYINDYVGFTLFGDDCDIVDQFGEDGTIIRVTGQPEINNYVKKDGTKVQSLQVKFAKVEVVSGGKSSDDVKQVEEYSDAPFDDDELF